MLLLASTGWIKVAQSHLRRSSLAVTRKHWFWPIPRINSMYSPNIKLRASTNMDITNFSHLFGNFFVAFSRVFACTLPPPPLPNTNGPISLAYAHKFMNLEYNQLGHFINQLSLAAQHFGVSSQDADTIRSSLNSKFNIRCAPATSSNPPMLNSLCQNPTCPLAVPVSDCAAYTNLTANGVTDSKPTTVSSLLSSSTSTAGAASSQPVSTAGGSASGSPGGLSTGGIAGVAVGGAAILLVAIIALFYFRRKRSRTPPPTAAGPPPAPAWNNQSHGSPTIHSTSTYMPKDPHQSYLSTGAPVSELGTSGYASPPASPDQIAHQGYGPYSEQTTGPWISPVEMEASRTPGVGTGPYQAPAAQSAVSPEWQRHSDNPLVQGHEQYPHQQWGR
jgi:hypothetical protein